jgi:hypothetical protein
MYSRRNAYKVLVGSPGTDGRIIRKELKETGCKAVKGFIWAHGSDK